MAEKNRYWSAVAYPENMIDTWRDDIGDILQLPYAYCIHDKDLLSDGDESRKVHVHIILAFNNTTTKKRALEIINQLSKVGECCCSTVQPIGNIKHMYEYLIHNTEESKKKNKFQYDVSERICGNNFDIGSFEQLSALEKQDMAKDICDLIIANRITNFAILYRLVMENFDANYFDVLRSNSGFFERLCKGFKALDTD